MILSNCHTHTNYCDGKATAEQMILSAIDKGFSSIGISSHSPMSGGCDWTKKRSILILKKSMHSKKSIKIAFRFIAELNWIIILLILTSINSIMR